MRPADVPPPSAPRSLTAESDVFRRWLLALPAALMVTGCSSLSALSETTSTAVSHCGPPHGMELIIGAHRNAPAPLLAPRLQCRVAAAVQAGKPVRIVVASGQPSFVRLRLQSVIGGHARPAEFPPRPA